MRLSNELRVGAGAAAGRCVEASEGSLLLLSLTSLSASYPGAPGSSHLLPLLFLEPTWQASTGADRAIPSAWNTSVGIHVASFRHHLLIAAFPGHPV